MFNKFVNVVSLLFLWTLVKGDCNVVQKKDWGGMEPTHVSYLSRPLDLVLVHHTETPSCISDWVCKEILRAIESEHVKTLGFWGIGSSFYVGGNGKVYEGAGWLHRGNHMAFYNHRSIGVSFIGNYNDEQPTDQMLEAAKDLLQCGVTQGHITQNYRVVAPRQLALTNDPGRYLYDRIKAWPEWSDAVVYIVNQPPGTTSTTTTAKSV